MSSVLQADRGRTVACVIPCYAPELEQLRATVFSALKVPSINLIVLVNDGHDDGAPFVHVQRDASRAPTPVRVLHLPENRGPAAAMNAGVGFLPDDALVCRLDVGDSFLPGAKDLQLATHLQSDLRPSFTWHHDAVERRDVASPHTWRTRIYKDGVFCICTAVFDRAVWAAVDGFDESLRYGDDWDFQLRVQHRIGWYEMPFVTCEAGAFPGGHTQRAAANPELAARKHADLERVRQRGLELSHPGHARSR